MKTIAFIAAVAAGLCLSVLAWAVPVQAQGVPCLVGPPDMLEQILSRSGEQPLIELQLSGGPDAPTTPALLAVGADGAFTLFMLGPDDAVCILASGVGAQPATGKGFPKPIIPGEDS